MDVWRRDDLADHSAPVLLFVPGVAWVHGSRFLQGYALMSHLAEKGWVCLSIDYRVAPHNPWPGSHHGRQGGHRLGQSQCRQVRR